MKLGKYEGAICGFCRKTLPDSATALRCYDSHARKLRMGEPGTGLTLVADPEVADLIDPTGELRREGKLDLARVPVIQDRHIGFDPVWTPRKRNVWFRICNLTNRLYRREASPADVFGPREHWVSLANKRLVHEWLAL